MSRKVEKITLDMNESRLPQDLDRYKEKALELGATNAKIIRAEEIPVDERVTVKCQIPRCFGYGVSAHCPPHTMKPAELKELLKKYHWAVFFTRDVPAEVIVRDKATIKERVAAYQEVFKIVSGIESMAFYDGHYLPNPSLITDPAKTADMISISSRGICGEEDFRRPRLRESIRLRGKTGILQPEKSLPPEISLGDQAQGVSACCPVQSGKGCL